MFVSSRIVKTLAATFIGAAFALCTGVVQAQISEHRRRSRRPSAHRGRGDLLRGPAQRGGRPDAEWRSCSLVARRFSAFLDARRFAVSPAAVMAQTARGIAIWDPR